MVALGFASDSGSFDLKRHLSNKRNKEVTKCGEAGERSKGEDERGRFCLLAAQKFRRKKGAGIKLGNCRRSRAPPGILSLPL